MHSLLKRQLRRYFGDAKPQSSEWQDFIELVNNAYHQFDTDRKMLERSLDLSSQELLQSNSNIMEVFERIITSSFDGIFAFDRNCCVTVWNPGMERITGVRREKAENDNIFAIFPVFKRTGDDKFIRESLSGKTTMAKESNYFVQETGQQGFFESHFSPLRSESGAVIGGLGIIRDITERKRVEEALAERSIRDPLTNLYNRRYFDIRILEEISRSKRERTSLAILLCDLDGFKRINNLHGHQFGDDVLMAVAKSVQHSVRGIDLVFRWGGDQIVVVMLPRTRQGTLSSAERIREGIKKVGQKLRFDLDMSIGIGLFPEHGTNIDEVTRLAENALYIAKKRGDKVHIGEDEYHLDEQVVQAAFQPVVDIQSDKIIGYEALARDAQGKISVFELFKKYEIIGQLETLKQICFRKQMKVARKLGLKKVFINVDFELLDRIEPFSKPSGIDVILEISEKEALYDVVRHLETARKWRSHGFKFAIDDFGAGFISLPFIAQLIPDYIKLDRSTVLQAVSSTKFRRFLNYLVMALSDYSKEGVIAEGIENEKELEVVKTMKIRLVQGYLFGKPKILDNPEDR